MTPLKEQWSYLDTLAQKSKMQGDLAESKKLLDCAATIKDLWIEAHKEMIDAMIDNRNELVGLQKTTADEFTKYSQNKQSVFSHAG